MQWKMLAVLLMLQASLEARPLPEVVPPGALQPRAPGQKEAPPLSRLEWVGRSNQIRKVEYASNGRLTIAHALILLKPGDPPWRFCREAAHGAFGSSAKLDELDISVYPEEGYLGFGGPPPVLTASVPRERLREFFDQQLSFERLWMSPGPAASPRAELEQREHNLVFHGEAPERREQIRLQHHVKTDHEHSVLYQGRHGHQEAALTFDDSPHPLFTPLLLDELQQSGVKATFFCIGRNARAYPYFIRDMARAGHEVANHTYHHVRLPGLSLSEVSREMVLANQVLEPLCGRPVRNFRPPGGEYSADTLRCARAAGLTTVFWTDDPGDFDNPGAEVIEDRLEEHLRPGGIVLLHDNVLQTLEILPHFLNVARKQGYRWLTTGELAERAGESNS